MKNFRKIYFPNFSASTFQQICMDVYEVYNKKDKKIKKQIEFKKLSFSGINLITEQKGKSQGKITSSLNAAKGKP